MHVHFALAVAVACWMAAACAPPAVGTTAPAAVVPAGDRTGNPALDQVVAGARTEGALSIIAGDSSLGGAEGVQQTAESLNRRYGLSLKVSFTTGPSMPEMAVRTAQELAAGRPASSDVFLGREAQVKALLEQAVLAPTDWAGLSPTIKPEMVAPDNVAVELAVAVAGVTYNTNLVPPAKVPRTSADLLLPEWSGKIASTPYATFFDMLGSPQLWGTERTIAYTRQFADNIGGVIRCGDASRIISGEFAMLAFDCGAMDARVWSRQGAPIEHAVLSDAAAVVYYYLGVPKNAPHPNAATLFVLESLTREGQGVLWERWGLDHPKVAGSHSRQEIDEAEAHGAKFVEGNVQFMMSFPEQESMRKQTQDIINRVSR
jgi:ABC-type Fe3+ transport system substrate-binding protein